MALAVAERVQKHREHLRASGLRLLQIWVPDTKKLGFAEECRRQSLIVANADNADESLQSFMDLALDDIEGWE
jgi:hypothetical protein